MTTLDVGRGGGNATRYAADGTPIDAYHDPGPSNALAVVVAHGFTGSWRRPALRRVAAVLREHAGVVSFDFRGHGRSGGVTTVGDREVLDVAAAVDWAVELGYERVATIGFSMPLVMTSSPSPLTGSSYVPPPIKRSIWPRT